MGGCRCFRRPTLPLAWAGCGTYTITRSPHGFSTSGTACLRGTEPTSRGAAASSRCTLRAASRVRESRVHRCLKSPIPCCDVRLCPVQSACHAHVEAWRCCKMAVLVAVVYRSPVERGVSTWLVSRLDSCCGCLAFLCTPSTALFLK